MKACKLTSTIWSSFRRDSDGLMIVWFMWERWKYQTKNQYHNKARTLSNFYYKTTTHIAVNKFLEFKLHFSQHQQDPACKENRANFSFTSCHLLGMQLYVIEYALKRNKFIELKTNYYHCIKVCLNVSP